MTKENYDKLVELEQSIESEANAIIKAIAAKGKEIQGEELFNNWHLDLTHLYYNGHDSKWINYFGSDSWAYGGYEEYHHDLPLSYLFDDNCLVIECAKFQKEKDDYEANLIKVAENKKAKELAQLEELKQKYGV